MNTEKQTFRLNAQLAKVFPSRANRSDYMLGMDKGVIFLVDLDLGNKSLTNDLDAVLGDLYLVYGRNVILDTPILYRDSTGRWDRLQPINTPYYTSHRGVDTCYWSFEFVPLNQDTLAQYLIDLRADLLK